MILSKNENKFVFFSIWKLNTFTYILDKSCDDPGEVLNQNPQ